MLRRKPTRPALPALRALAPVASLLHTATAEGSPTPPPGLLQALVIPTLQGATGQCIRTISGILAGCGKRPKPVGSPRQPDPASPPASWVPIPSPAPGACPAHLPGQLLAGQSPSSCRRPRTSPPRPRETRPLSLPELGEEAQEMRL